MNRVLVIPGGGVSGRKFFDATVQILLENPGIDKFVGSSAGSIVSVVAALIDRSRLEDSEYMDPIVDRLVEALNPMNTFMDLSDLFFGSGISIREFGTYVSDLFEHLRPGVCNMTMAEFNESISSTVIISAFDISNHGLDYIWDDKEMKLIDVVLASCSFFMFGQYKDQTTGRRYIDSNNIQDFPFDVLIRGDKVSTYVRPVPFFDEPGIVIVDDSPGYRDSGSDASIMQVFKTWRQCIYQTQFNTFAYMVRAEGRESMVSVFSIEKQKVVSLTDFDF